MAETKYKDLEDVAPILKDDDDPEQTFMSEMRGRFEKCLEHDRELRLKALEDIRFTFVPGYQWDAYTSELRGGRPCYEFNKVRQSIRQITGDQLQNRPSGKVIADEDGDEDTAEIYEGIIRNIEAVSHAERAYDGAFNYSCAGGYGAWRITTDYKDDDDFEQDLFVKPIANPFAAYCDPDAKEFDRRDAEYWFIKDSMSRHKFEQKYPDADIADFFGDGLDTEMLCWVEGQNVVIAEYWYKVPTKKTIVQLSDGRVVSEADFVKWQGQLASQQITEKNRKTIDTYDIKMEIVTGTHRLEGPFDWAGKFIPIIPLWGDLINVEGKDIWSGAVRFAKDGQRLFNFEQSTLVELVAKQPQQPLTAVADAIKGYEAYYEDLSDKDVPVLPYNLVPSAPGGGRPERVQPAMFPAAWANLSAEASDNIKATLGIYDASLGARSNETSGVAINQRKQQGAVANFVYIDNLAKALAYTYEILVDMIPLVIDTERVLRILGPDGAKKWVTVNKAMQDPQTGQWVVMNDLSRGKYSVTCKAGPSFTTQREELAAAAMQLSNNPGPYGLMWQYIYVSNSDLPGADEVKIWMRQFLVKQGLAPPDENTPPPPEQPPPPPDPRVVADVNLKGSQTALAQANAEKTQAQTQEIMASLPVNIDKTRAQAQEQSAKAVRNVAETHQGIVEHTLQTDPMFKVPQDPIYGIHPQQAPMPDPTSGGF